MDKETQPRHSSFEIKSADLPLVALLLKTNDLNVLKKEIELEFGPESESADFFDHDALVIDFGSQARDVTVDELTSLVATLQSCSLLAVAVRHATQTTIENARSIGLVEATSDVHHLKDAKSNHSTTVEVIKEVIREVSSPQTMIIDKPLRSGQKVYAKGCDLVVLAMVNQGAEVVADGNIHVYAPLRGKAMAGARGNTEARIFTVCLEPELISIAGVYKTSEHALPKDVQGKPAQVRLSNDGQEKLLIEPLNS